MRIEFIQKDYDDTLVKMQPKLTFETKDKSHDNYDSYTFKHIEILMDEPMNLGFFVRIVKIANV